MPPVDADGALDALATGQVERAAAMAFTIGTLFASHGLFVRAERNFAALISIGPESDCSGFARANIKKEMFPRVNVPVPGGRCFSW